MMRLFSFALALGGVLLLGGCPEFSGNGAPEGFRLLSGSLVLPDDGIVGRQVTALQVAAVAVVADVDDDGNLSTNVQVFTSDPFDPGVRRDESYFVLAIDGAVSFNLVLQVPSGSGQGPGEYLGRLEFDDGSGIKTTLVPDGITDIELGVVNALEQDPSRRDDNLLQVAAGNNPLGQVDTDGDGTADLFDDDDDGDGVVDSSDADVAGDGLDDSLQTLWALQDDDADGIPDIFD